MTRTPQAVRSANAAVRRANESLDLLGEIDDVLRQAADLRMAPVFERVLTNNAPAPNGLVLEPVDWSAVPLEYRVLALCRWAATVLYGWVSMWRLPWPEHDIEHIRECFETVTDDEAYDGECCEPWKHRAEEPHLHITCRADRIHDDFAHYDFHGLNFVMAERLFREIMIRRTRWDPCPWLVQEHVDADGNRYENYGNWLYRLNFVREDLRDLYV